MPVTRTKVRAPDGEKVDRAGRLLVCTNNKCAIEFFAINIPERCPVCKRPSVQAKEA